MQSKLSISVSKKRCEDKFRNKVQKSGIRQQFIDMASPEKRLFFGRHFRQLQNTYNSVALDNGTAEVYISLAAGNYSDLIDEHQRIVADLNEETLLDSQEAIFYEIEGLYIHVQAALAAKAAKISAITAAHPQQMAMPEQPSYDPTLKWVPLRDKHEPQPLVHSGT